MTWQEEWNKYRETKYACFIKNRHRRKDGTFWESIDMSDISHVEDVFHYASLGNTIYKLAEVPKEELDDIVRIYEILKKQEIE